MKITDNVIVVLIISSPAWNNSQHSTSHVHALGFAGTAPVTVEACPPRNDTWALRCDPGLRITLITS